MCSPEDLAQESPEIPSRRLQEAAQRLREPEASPTIRLGKASHWGRKPQASPAGLASRPPFTESAGLPAGYRGR